MPPRFTFWTIIIDGQPTAFRAAEREELAPTLKQLQAKNPTAVMKWFAQGRVWESPDEARNVRAAAEAAAHDAARDAVLKERRDREWRPGGEHRDPREKFKKETFQARKRREKKAANLAGEPRSGGGGAPSGFRPKGPGQSGPGAGHPRPGGWSREGGRPEGRSFGGGQGGFRPKGPGQSGPGGVRPRTGGWGGGDRGGGPGRPQREARRPAPRQAPPQAPLPRPPSEAPPPQGLHKPAEPVSRVTPPADPRPPTIMTPPVAPGPPAPAHKTRLPRLRKP
jgi:hypothetical protein